jgi:hypothetical protein
MLICHCRAPLELREAKRVFGSLSTMLFVCESINLLFRVRNAQLLSPQWFAIGGHRLLGDDSTRYNQVELPRIEGRQTPEEPHARSPFCAPTLP